LSPSRDTDHDAARATASDAIASPVPSFFGNKSDSYFGRSARSFNAPHASIARVRSGPSPCPVAYENSAADAFLFCT